MCGIIAFIPRDTTARYDMDRGLDAMAHRGSDERIIKFYDHCVIGYLRMSVTDQAAPAVGKANGLDVYLNGEIYNYKELGYTGSETEVLAKGFFAEGDAFAERLNGMFSIIVVSDTEVKTYSDRYGIKPLYFADLGNGVICSSEIKPILNYEGFERRIDFNRVKEWMTVQHPLSQSMMLHGIYDLARINRSRAKWQWKFEPDYSITYEFAVSEVRRLLLQAINRMRVDEPSGVCLSGGIDSGILAAHTGSAHSFTVGYEGTEDERPMARLMARDHHHEIVYNRVEHLPETIFYLEDLRAGASWPNYGMYQEAKNYVRILFDGAGADELFAGYEWRYHNTDYWQVVNRTRENIPSVQRYYEGGNWNFADRFTYDAQNFLPSVLMVGDKLSMAHTLEVRYPFLDNDLVDFCLTIPYEFKKNKQVLKDAFACDLPSEILNGPKRGFTSPDWIAGEGNQARKWSVEAFKTWRKIFTNEQ